MTGGAVAEFGRAKEDWLRQFLPLPNGIPSHDTFGRVFSLIDPDAFEAAFFDWAAHARIGGDALGQLALDGKTARRTHQGAAGRALHLLHAWSCETGLLPAQRAVDAKSNEITAIPDILSLFDLRGITVSIDAIGCQKTVARQIAEGRGDHVLALKGNQSTLHDDVRLFMDTVADRPDRHGRRVAAPRECRKCRSIFRPRPCRGRGEGSRPDRNTPHPGQ